MFQYQDFPGASSDHIRVLKVLPSDDPSSTIDCTVEVISLNDNPIYHALSYVWGSTTSPKHIHLNGHDFPVGDNLHDFLWHLRQWGSPAIENFLWIDAICINQADIAERNATVINMGRIYKSAQVVVSWLGSEGPVARGMMHLASIARKWAALDQTEGAPDPWEVHLFEESPQLWKDWLCDTRELWHDPEGLDGMVRFFLSNYWRRIWIVQEVILANFSSHELVCGHASIKFADLDTFVQCVVNLFRREKPNEIDSTAWTHISMGIIGECVVLKDLIHVRFRELEPSLMFVLYVSSTRHSSDPRDAVYGLLNVIPGQSIVPDYNKTVRAIYVEWAKETMIAAGNMTLISFAGKGNIPRYDSELDLPSWVPDLHSDKRYRPLNWWKPNDRKAQATITPFSIDIAPGDVLKARGYVLGTIDEAKTLEYDKTDGNVPRKGDSTSAYMQFCMTYLKKHRSSEELYKTGIPHLQALIRLTMRTQLPDPSAEWDLKSKSLHKVACNFITWLIFKFHGMYVHMAPPGEPLEVAARILGLSWDDGFPETYQTSVFPSVDVGDLFQWNTLMNAMELGTNRDEMIHYMLKWSDGKTMLETKEGYLGYGPTKTEPGDVVCSLMNCKDLLVLRKVDSSYVLLGSCYFVGLSDGEAEVLATETGIEAHEICIS